MDGRKHTPGAIAVIFYLKEGRYEHREKGGGGKRHATEGGPA